MSEFFTVLAVASLVCVLPLAAAVYFGIRWDTARRERDQSRAALARSQEHAEKLRQQLLRVREEVRQTFYETIAEADVEVAKLKGTVAFACKEIDELTRQRDAAILRSDRQAQDRAAAEANTATVVLELTHRLEHAEQSVREGVARAVRDSQANERLERTLAAERGLCEKYHAQWRLTAAKLIEKGIRLSHATQTLGRTIEALTALTEASWACRSDAVAAVVAAATREPSDADRDRTDRSVRISNADVVPPDMLPDGPDAPDAPPF